MTTKNQLSLRMGEEVDILELFFEALSTPKNSIVTELLSGNGDKSDILGGSDLTPPSKYDTI